MQLIKSIMIPDPPSKLVKEAKSKIDPKTGELKKQTFYLSANLFMSEHLHFSSRNWIFKTCKNFLLIYCQGLPKLEKMRLVITYYRMNEGFDLDNKSYFWSKIFLDLLKTPTSKQIVKAEKYKNPIISLNILKDDTVRYLDDIHWKFEKGEHAIKFDIYGRLLDEQKKLF